ncbi:MAG: polyphosphate polymerase domain-containing protein [Spirochaetaceae bacterium]|jgi:hypothetical protein|nr:polyphosphate polymerase domain-containing protein [Spirochaetaceae bacterium]
MYQMVFQRYEKKYLLSRAQYEALSIRLNRVLEPDQYGPYTAASLYYDTGCFDLARASARQSRYKEKLRLRGYGTADSTAPVFLELKKKFQGVVHKRRACLPYGEVPGFFANRPYRRVGADGQVFREIDGFLARHPSVSAKMFLAYDRIALEGDGGLRVTFDTNIRFRRTGLRLDADSQGTSILESGQTLMEVKTPGAIPLWLCRALSECGAFPVSFSKYGTCCRNCLPPVCPPRNEPGRIMEDICSRLIS